MTPRPDRAAQWHPVAISIAAGLLLGGAWLSVSIYFLSQLHSADATRALADRIRIALLEARRREKDFLARSVIDASFYLSGRHPYLDLHRQALDRMTRASAELIDRTPGNSLDLRSLEEQRKQYDESFTALVACYRRLGNREFGLEGAWHQGAQELERAVDATGNAALHLEGLLLKADEKDYLLRMDEASLHALHRRADHLREALHKDPTSPVAVLDRFLDRYLQDLAAFHATQQEIGLDENLGHQGRFREAAHAIEPIVARVTWQADQAYSSAKRSLTGGLAVSSALLCLLLAGTFFLTNATRRRSHQLSETTRELSRSNAELQQFAYVASHDLQEPLRAVAGCVQLLEQRLEGKLDERNGELIRHSVEGCVRMQTLIEDLLTLSRVGTQAKPFVATEVGAVVRAAVANLAVPIREAQAVLTQDPLPTVQADPTQLLQVFQNLLGNALKFRSEHPPAIHIGAEREEKAWKFSIRDNGIGIEAQYFERIFRVFQRLHTREQYPGSGIGLAVCEKIVLRHGGRIWLQSELNRGTTFFFTVPDRDAAQ